MITIVDYGIGNLGSVWNMFRKIGVQAKISKDKTEIEQADKLLLPGVGAFDVAMHRLDSLGMIELLNYKIIDQKTPVLGICLGMQLLSMSSDEGTRKGLGWIDAQTISFKKNINLNVPHMGWNDVRVNQCMLITDILPNSRFYFVHSYHVVCNNPDNIMLKAKYGIEFNAGICKDNIFGVQFHPEKSHKFGMKLLENFSKI
jgi:imidazole glycerol-phosphate synthase subunit HisH